MVKRNPGYTLVEVMIVLAVAGVLAVITFFGVSAYKQGDAVTNAQKEFVSNLRATQNKVDNGADGLSVWTVTLPAAGSSYTINGTPIPLPSGVTMDNPLGAITVCFANQNLTAFTTNVPCGVCVGNTGYVCDGLSLSSPALITVTFTNGTFSKDAYIEGAGKRINRIYAQGGL